VEDVEVESWLLVESRDGLGNEDMLEILLINFICYG
jgi:hypothetical protein